MRKDVCVSMINKIVEQSISNTPKVEGPIPVTETSHPFSAANYARKPLDLDLYGYTEEEYFLSGTANVYQGETELELKHEALPYKNRIMIRKPAPEKFSGRVFLDIYNASNGYDIEDVWRRSYQYYLERGHIYIGVTTKPINVMSLKNFDPDRYESLNWASKERAPMPAVINKHMSIPGTEEGLAWDIISQLGRIIKENDATFLDGYNVEQLYLTGQSQSGIYLNTYIYFFHEFMINTFDGYLNVVGAGSMRTLDQQVKPEGTFSSITQLIPKNLKTPFILLSSHGDIELFGQFGDRGSVLKALNETDGPIRHYELTSSPHTDPASPLIPDNSEIVKTKNPPKILDGEYHYEVNSIQLAYYVNSTLEMLHEWAVNDVEPPQNLLIDRNEDGTTPIDEHENGLGGLRSPYIDVPIATYHPNAIADPEQINRQVGNVNGSMTYFDKDKLNKLYESKADYLEKFEASVRSQETEGWLIPEDAERMITWAKEQSEKLF